MPIVQVVLVVVYALLIISVGRPGSPRPSMREAMVLLVLFLIVLVLSWPYIHR
jgi:hypothetical protein